MVVSRDGPEEFTISGIVGFGDADNLAGATLAAFDTPTAQRVLDKEGEFDPIDVVADEGTDGRGLRRAIQRRCPSGVEAVKASDVADEQAKQLQDGLGFFRTALLVFAFIALFVGAFIIFNTFSIIVAQRTREMALAARRSAPAAARSSRRSCIEAFVPGWSRRRWASSRGSASRWACRGCWRRSGSTCRAPAPSSQPRTIVVVPVVGTVVTVVASILPARRAARVAPVQALRESADSADRSLRRRLIVGLIVTARRRRRCCYGLFGEPVERRLRLIGLGAAGRSSASRSCSPLIARPLAGCDRRPVRGRRIAGPARVARTRCATPAARRRPRPR